MYLVSKPDTNPSPVTVVKSHEKKSQNYFRSMVKCRWNFNFEEIDAEPSTGKNEWFWLLWRKFKDHIKKIGQSVGNTTGSNIW